MPFILQILGWALVAGLDLAMNRAAWPEGDLVWAIYEAVALGSFGFVITSALLLAYKRWLPSRGVKTAVVALAGAVAAAAILYVGIHLLDVALGDPYRASLSADLFGTGMVFFFIMVSWHAAFLALRASARAADAERLAQEARLLALRYQLNPHFLFNVLNSAIALVDEDPKRAQTMLTLLSGLLRRTLDDETGAETSLGRELEMIDRYMEIQHIRYEEKLKMAIDVPEAARACAVPPLVVHALVENAVKHGLSSAAVTPVEIGLTASYDGQSLRIEVRNSGHLAPNGNGVGLKNVADRLNALYPGRHRFAVEERDGAVRATMEIQAPRKLP